MAILQINAPVRVEDRFQHAAQVTLRLRNALTGGRVLDVDFDSALSALERLPLATDEFGVARARVRNAMLMIARDEPGAAAYELMLLANWLTAKA